MDSEVAAFWKAGSLKFREPFPAGFATPSLPWHIAHFCSYRVFPSSAALAKVAATAAAATIITVRRNMAITSRLDTVAILTRELGYGRGVSRSGLFRGRRAVDRQDRAGRLPENPLRDRSEDQVAPAGPPVRRDDHEVDPLLLRDAPDLGRCVAAPHHRPRAHAGGDVRVLDLLDASLDLLADLGFVVRQRHRGQAEVGVRRNVPGRRRVDGQHVDEPELRVEVRGQ